jgi:hypothetical protein
MSAATFQSLREEFVRGWVGLGGKQFTLHIFTPSFSQGGHCPNDPYWKEILPFDRKTDKLLGAVHMPYSANTDDRENFTNTPGSVVVKPSPSFMTAKDAPLFASACELFQQLCEKAGAALPEVIRKRLEGYCTWQCNSPASWWFALLAHMTGKIVYHSDGTYNDHNFISGPWELSIRLIDHFGLNTDSPTWPEDGTADDEQPRHSPVTAKSPRNQGGKRLTIEQRMKLVLFEKPESSGWTITEFQAELQCSRGGIHKTASWQALEAARKLGKAERRNDRQAKTR